MKVLMQKYYSESGEGITILSSKTVMIYLLFLSKYFKVLNNSSCC